MSSSPPPNLIATSSPTRRPVLAVSAIKTRSRTLSARFLKTALSASRLIVGCDCRPISFTFSNMKLDRHFSSRIGSPSAFMWDSRIIFTSATISRVVLGLSLQPGLSKLLHLAVANGFDLKIAEVRQDCG